MEKRNRCWRRKKTEAKWNSRCKKFCWDSMIEDARKLLTYIDTHGTKKTVSVCTLRHPSSWKEMKQKDPWAKYLKNHSTSRSWVSEQLDAKRANKLQREDNKKIIKEGIKEYDELYDESDEILAEDILYCR